MKLQQILFNNQNDLEKINTSNNFDFTKANLVLTFGEREQLDLFPPYEKLKELYPNAHIVICSTSGQISNNNLVNNQIVATAIELEKTDIKVLEINLLNINQSSYSQKINDNLITNDLKALLVFSDGTNINGTELVNELQKIAGPKIPIFGGLAGDGIKFSKTTVGLNKNASDRVIALIGFYGNHIHFGFGCEGGWTNYGPEREVTHSEKNVLYKINNRYALDLYKEYLGLHANDLPGSAINFPLSMKENTSATPVIRTILSMDEQNKSMTFAGNIPQGSFVRLMEANLDKLIDASYESAKKSIQKQKKTPDLALIVSCVGRKLVLKNRINEEFEAIKEAYGDKSLLCGFYSYGEISPTYESNACKLHNQTISILSISED